MRFSVKILGSTSATPTSDSFSTAQVLRVHERFFLIDCAEGTQILLRKYKIPFSKINDIFISHLHGDHFYGIFGVVSTFNLMGRKNPLHIYAHKNLKTIYDTMHELTDFKTNFEVVFHPLNFDGKKLILENKKIEVYSFPLKHRIETCGFLFLEKEALRNMKKDVIPFFNIPYKEIPNIKKGADYITEDGKVIDNKQLTTPPPLPRSYAFCSDTAYTESIIPYIENVDLLYHEATYTESEKESAARRGHSTAAEAAHIAKLANAKKLVLGHFSVRYRNKETLLNEAREIFENTDIAIEGRSFDVELMRPEN